LASQKIGLDDLIIAKGIDAVRALIDNTPEWALSRELHELSAQYCILRDSGQVYEYDTGNTYLAETFLRVIEANRKMTVDAATGLPSAGNSREHERDSEKKGRQKLKVVAAARLWIESKGRAEFEGRTYAPNEGRVTSDGKLNLYRACLIEPHEGDVGPYLELLQHLVPNSEELACIERWAAYPLQKPGERNNFGAMMWGPQGNGKSLTAQTYALLHGNGNWVEIGQAELDSTFNSWAEGRTYIIGSEVSGERGARPLADKLKSLITADAITINRKHQPTFLLPNCANYFFTSNHDNALFIDDEARRYLVLHAAATALPAKFYTDFVKWRNSGGLAALKHRLLSLDLSNYNAKGHAPKTGAREAMIDASRTPLQRWVRELRENPDTALAVGLLTTPGMFFTTRDLCAAFSRVKGCAYVNEHAMGRALRAEGFGLAYNGNQVPMHSGIRLRLWAIRDVLRAANMSAAQIAITYASAGRSGKEVA